MKNKLFYLILITLLSIFAVFPLFNKGFFSTDDGEWMIIRFSAFHQSLREGQFPVRFLDRLNHGYGYPVSNFLYPGFMYLSEPIHLIGFGFVDSVKIIIIISMLGSAIFTFLWLLKLFDNFSSITGSIIYLYFPYHLYDLYKRGSVGELLSIALLPFVLWQIERESLFWTAIGVAFIIISHNILAVLFLPLIIGYMFIKLFIYKKKLQLIYKHICMLVTGFGLSAFFWLPAILELKLTRFTQTQISDWKSYFVSPQLINFSILIIMCASGYILLRYKRLKQNNLLKIALLFLVTGIVSSFLSYSKSSVIWQILPVSFVQFPYRFLSLVIICSAILSAYLISNLKSAGKIVFTSVLVVLLIYYAYPLISNVTYFNKGEGFYSTNEDTTTVKNEYMPLWVRRDPQLHFTDKVQIVSGDAKITNMLFNSKRITFDFKAMANSLVRINTIYYPGWKVYLDGKETAISYNDTYGVMDLTVPKDTTRIELVFNETILRLLADFISLLSILLLVVVSLSQRKQNR
jgi:hypothetical protein